MILTNPATPFPFDYNIEQRGDRLVLFAPAAVKGEPQPLPPAAAAAAAATQRTAAAAAAERLKRHGGYNAPPKRVIVAGYAAEEIAVRCARR